MEVEAGDGLRAVNVQLAGHAVQVGQVQLDAANGHHAGQEEVHVPKLVPGHLRREVPRSSQPQREAAWSRPPRTRPSLPSRPRPPAAGTPRSAICQTGPGRCGHAAVARPGGLSGHGWSSLSPSTPERVATAHTATPGMLGTELSAAFPADPEVGCVISKTSVLTGEQSRRHKQFTPRHGLKPCPVSITEGQSGLEMFPWLVSDRPALGRDQLPAPQPLPMNQGPATRPRSQQPKGLLPGISQKRPWLTTAHCPLLAELGPASCPSLAVCAEFTCLWAADRPGVALRPGQGPGAAVSLAQASDKLRFLSSCFPCLSNSCVMPAPRLSRDRRAGVGVSTLGRVVASLNTQGTPI